MPKKGYIHGVNTSRDIHETKNTKLPNNLEIEADLWNIYINFVLNCFLCLLSIDMSKHSISQKANGEKIINFRIRVFV